MKHRSLLILSALALSLSALPLTSCGNNNPEPSKESHVYSIPEQFQQGDDNAHLSEPNAPVHTIRIHYHRFDDNYGDFQTYLNWSLWLWDVGNGGNGQRFVFDRYDDFGVYRDVPDTLYKNLKTLGFIVACISESGRWYDKDYEEDRTVEFEGEAPGGIKDIYLVTRRATIFEEKENAFKPIITTFRFSDDSRKKLRLAFEKGEKEFTFDPKGITLTIDGKESKDFTCGEWSGSHVELTFPNDLPLDVPIHVSYAFDDKWTDEKDVIITKYFDSKEFVDQYLYEGDDLGVTFDNPDSPSKTIFKVWAPTSKSVTLRLFEKGNPELEPNPAREIAMEKGEKGVFFATVEEDLDGKYYTYEVTNARGVNEVVDPYAKSAGVNGKRGMVVNFKKLNAQLPGWSTDVRPEIASPSQASIYEIHVRDMTISPTSGLADASLRGTYAGLAVEGTSYADRESGKTVATGLDHLAELGVTHVQIQPFYDYSSVDERDVSREMSADNYNWGYDPQNYNVLEGSYSTDPEDGYVRIREFKNMMMALHKKGLNVNMDVVYNHTSSTQNSNFQLLVPYYYYRASATGKLYNGSGCGNEVASDRPMMRKFILDSIRFYTDEYHLSGYRFDLMGLEDNQTMIDVYKEVTKIYDKGMVYGEPWDMGNLKTDYDADKLSQQKTLQKSLSQSYFYGSGVYVGAFNDVFRNASRGDNAPGKGYVQGDASYASKLEGGIKGVFSLAETTLSPEQCLNYASCHDNYTLFDQIAGSLKTEEVVPMVRQANALVALSNGVAFFQEGDDFLRSKVKEDGKYDENSYKSGDFINAMDYAKKAKNIDVVKSFEDALELRNANSLIGLTTREDIASSVKDFKAEGGLITYAVEKGSSKILVAHANAEATLQASGTVVYDSLGLFEVGASVTNPKLAANQSIVLA